MKYSRTKKLIKLLIKVDVIAGRGRRRKGASTKNIMDLTTKKDMSKWKLYRLQFGNAISKEYFQARPFHFVAKDCYCCCKKCFSCSFKWECDFCGEQKCRSEMYEHYSLTRVYEDNRSRVYNYTMIACFDCVKNSKSMPFKDIGVVHRIHEKLGLVLCD